MDKRHVSAMVSSFSSFRILSLVPCVLLSFSVSLSPYSVLPYHRHTLHHRHALPASFMPLQNQPLVPLLFPFADSIPWGRGRAIYSFGLPGSAVRLFLFHPLWPSPSLFLFLLRWRVYGSFSLFLSLFIFIPTLLGMYLALFRFSPSPGLIFLASFGHVLSIRSCRVLQGCPSSRVLSLRLLEEILSNSIPNLALFFC